MRALKTLAFGAVALLVANFATAAQAKADSFGVYLGSNGFGIQVNDYGRYGGYYGGYYGAGYYGSRGCWDPYYGRYFACGYSNYYYPGYYGSYRYRPRLHFRHWDRGPYGWHGDRGHGWNNHWSDHGHRNWGGGDRHDGRGHRGH